MAAKIADGAETYLAALSQGLTPDPPLWVDAWAETFGRIPRGTAAEYGRYRVERTPYAREVLKCLSPSHPARRVVAKVASQLFKTQVGLMAIGAWMHRAPGNILVLEPTDRVAKRLSSRIDKTILETPELAAIVAKPRSRDSSNTVDVKEFDGATLYITTAGSAANLSEVPVRYVYGDEIDRWERNVDGEGSPRELAETRASTFGRNAKIYYSSSPTEEGSSEIDDLYRHSDQRVYEVPCPHCQTRLVLEWGQMRWEDDFTRAWYECPHCAERIEEQHKPAILAAGEWRATAKGDGETVGFHLNALYAPLGWTSWTQLAQQFVKASTTMERGDMEAMQVFYNTRLGLTWDVCTERVQADQLRALVEDFPLGIAPAGVLALTAAVDVQGDRLELLIIGWGEGMERWTVAQHVVPGDPTAGDTWRALDELLLTPIHNSHGIPMHIEAVAVDSGAYTQDVYDYARTRRRRRIGEGLTQSVLAVKGHPRPGRPIIATKPTKVDVTQRGTTLRHGTEVWIVGVDTAKDWLHPRMLMTSGPGGIHYSKQLPDDWFDQVTSEVKRARYVRGFRRHEWHKLKNAPNEALDLLVYNLALAYHLELHKRPPAFWERRRDRFTLAVGDLFGPSAVTPRKTDVTDHPVERPQWMGDPTPPAPRTQSPGARPRAAPSRAPRPRAGSFLR